MSTRYPLERLDQDILILLRNQAADIQKHRCVTGQREPSPGRVAGSLRHRHVEPVLDQGEAAPVVRWIALEFVFGRYGVGDIEAVETERADKFVDQAHRS